METTTPPYPSKSVDTPLSRKDFLGNYSGSDTTRPAVKFVFNFNNLVRAKDNEITLSFDNSDVTVVAQKVRPQNADDEVIKMLESWLYEEETEEGEKKLQELRKSLEEDRISFSEIT